MKATLWGVSVSVTLGVLIVVGSRNLQHFDAALVGYTFATLFAAFGLVYRYAMWLQRPPTAMYWRRGWQVFFKRGYGLRNIANWLDRVIGDIALNRFIWRRGPLRWSAHWLIMWGTFLAAAITFPLVFGWVHFDTLPDNVEWYRMFVFGFPTVAFPIYSFFGFMVVHGLVWSAILVIVGVMIAMRRRMRDRGAAALQRFGEDFLPLVFLFAISLTGLLLTASYTWMKGYLYDFLAVLHAITVIFTLLWLPFGKFFHIFQRPAQIGAAFYKDVGYSEEPALCRRCSQPFTSQMHVQDLIRVERELGYRYDMPDTRTEHYQWICPPCRRAMFALAQGNLWRSQRGGGPLNEISPSRPSTPTYANPAPGEGPLGEEDAKNFHP
ncbi:MAG: MFS transporter [Armatimonadetes bacterium]|nr:MFS transporter [Armatimonadota bacterium]